MAGRAILTAIGARKAAKDARKDAKKAADLAGKPVTTDETVSRDPYGPAADYINDAFRIINEEFQRGAHQIGTGAKRAGGGGAAAVPEAPVPPGGKRLPDGKVVNRKGEVVWDPQFARGGGGGGGGGKAPPGGGAGGGGDKAAKKGSADWYADVAGRRTTKPVGGTDAAEQWAEAQLAGGSDSAPFATNPILNDLYGRLDGADFDRTQDLFGEFIGDTRAGAGGGQQGDGVGVPRAGAGLGGYRVASYTTGSKPPANAGGGMIPDTMSQPGWVQDRIRELWDPAAMDPANDPTMQPLLDALKREMGEDLDAQLQDIGDEYSGVNMYGSSGLNLERARTREEGMEAYGGTAAALLKQARDDAWTRRMSGLGTVSDRDLAAMNDRTAREAIASGERSAGASAGAAAASQQAALAAQERMFNREMQLKGILGMQGMDQFGLSTLAGLGGELGDTQQFAAGLTPDLAASRRDDLTTGFGIRNTLDQQAYARQQAAAAAARQQQMDRAMAAGRDLDDYLARLTGLAGPYGTTSSHRVVTDPGRGAGFLVGLPSPTGAALTEGMRVAGEDAGMAMDAFGGIMSMYGGGG